MKKIKLNFDPKNPDSESFSKLVSNNSIGIKLWCLIKQEHITDSGFTERCLAVDDRGDLVKDESGFVTHYYKQDEPACYDIRQEYRADLYERELSCEQIDFLTGIFEYHAFKKETMKENMDLNFLIYLFRQVCCSYGSDGKNFAIKNWSFFNPIIREPIEIFFETKVNLN